MGIVISKIIGHMKISIRVVAFFFFLISGTYVFGQEGEKSSIVETIEGKKYYIHLIQPGETLGDLGKLYGVSTEKIIESTPSLEREDNLRPNQILRIPVAAANPMSSDKVNEVSEKPRPGQDDSDQQQESGETGEQRKKSADKKLVYHKVNEGETLFSISQKYKVTVEQIKNVNPGLTQNISPGKTINIPLHLAGGESSKKIEDKGVFKGNRFNAYQVKKGETIYRIAKNFGISQKRLLNMNPEISVNNLNVGSRIRIPIEGESPVLQAKTSSSDNESAQADKQDIPEKQEEQDTIQTYRYYKVKFLERVPGISKRQNIDIDTIYKLNPGIKKEGVNWGDVIKLPREAEVKSAVYEQDTPEDMPSDTTINYIVHRVMKKETLYRIAKLYDVSQSAIVELNPGADKQIEKGRKLKIPVKKPTTKVETVQEEEEKNKAEEKDVFKSKCLEQSGMGQRFKIALMVPLYLENYKAIDTSDFKYNKPKGLKSLNFIQFYEGALLALDTLEKQGMKSDVYVYDVGKSREKAIRSIDQKLQDVDLIIGPVYNEPFNVISEFAQKHDIRIVNPLSGRKSIIEDKEGVFKVQAPERVEMKAMSKYINKHYPDTTDIYIVRDNKYVEKENLEMLREKLRVDTASLFSPIRRIVDIKYVTDSLNPVLSQVDSLNKSREIVVALTHNRVFTIELLRHLNEARDSIGGLTVFGKSSWRDYGLDSEYLMNLDVHLFDDEYIQYDSSNVKWFLSHYREKYKTEPLPEKYAYTGFDIMYYFGSALMRFGKDFEKCLKYHRPNTLELIMRFRENDSGSFENIHSSPLRYYNYKLIKMD